MYVEAVFHYMIVLPSQSVFIVLFLEKKKIFEAIDPTQLNDDNTLCGTVNTIIVWLSLKETGLPTSPPHSLT